MDPNFRALPPLKKRRRSQEPAASGDSITTYCLQAKKRVWPFRPDISPDQLFSPFDLNKPPAEEEEVTISIPCSPVNGTSTSTAQCIEDEEDDGIVCAICQSSDGDPSDPIVFCDGCDMTVHSSCYGNPLIQGVPDGDWFCARCSDKTSDPISCCLCPVAGGAVKPTADGRWAHVVCALFVPEAFFKDPVGRESIDCSMVPKRRWKDLCYICNKRIGCAIDCSELKCPLAFHVTCGLKEDLCIEYREEKKNRGAVVSGFCSEHSELWKKQQETGKFKIVPRED